MNLRRNSWTLPESWKKKGVGHKDDSNTNHSDKTWNNFEKPVIETIQTIALLRSVRILRRVWESGRDLLSIRLVKTTSYYWCEKLTKSKMMMIDNASEKKMKMNKSCYLK